MNFFELNYPYFTAVWTIVSAAEVLTVTIIIYIQNAFFNNRGSM